MLLSSGSSGSFDSDQSRHHHSYHLRNHHYHRNHHQHHRRRSGGQNHPDSYHHHHRERNDRHYRYYDPRYQYTDTATRVGQSHVAEQSLPPPPHVIKPKCPRPQQVVYSLATTSLPSNPASVPVVVIGTPQTSSLGTTMMAPSSQEHATAATAGATTWAPTLVPVHMEGPTATATAVPSAPAATAASDAHFVTAADPAALRPAVPVTIGAAGAIDDKREPYEPYSIPVVAVPVENPSNVVPMVTATCLTSPSTAATVTLSNNKPVSRKTLRKEIKNEYRDRKNKMKNGKKEQKREWKERKNECKTKMQKKTEAELKKELKKGWKHEKKELKKEWKELKQELKACLK